MAKVMVTDQLMVNYNMLIAAVQALATLQFGEDVELTDSTTFEDGTELFIFEHDNVEGVIIYTFTPQGVFAHAVKLSEEDEL